MTFTHTQLHLICAALDLYRSVNETNPYVTGAQRTKIHEETTRLLNHFEHELAVNQEVGDG